MLWYQACLPRRPCCPCCLEEGSNLQIQDDDDLAMGARPVLRRRRVRGIINGLDTSSWDPQIDEHLMPRMRFDRDTVSRGKAAAKAWLQVCD